MRYIPNLLSIVRIAASGGFVVEVLGEDFGVALIIFLIASVTDFLDGFLARKWRVESEWGRLLDPLADKILMTAAYFTLSHMGHIPAYVTVIVIGRDALILLAVLLCKAAKVSLSINPLMSSKINTSIQLLFILIVLACKYLPLNVPSFLEVCSLIVCASTIFSGADYLRKYYWIKDAICKCQVKR